MLERVQVRRETKVSVDAEFEGFGRRLQSFFDGVTVGPMPDRLTKLADELEAALERGEIHQAF